MKATETKMARTDIRDIDLWCKVAQQSAYKAGVFARNLKITPWQLRRHAQKLYGQSPQVWLTEQRLLAAAQMLKDHRSVKVVVSELGYRHGSHFSSQFKHRYGISPTEYLAKSDRNVRFV